MTLLCVYCIVFAYQVPIIPIITRLCRQRDGEMAACLVLRGCCLQEMVGYNILRAQSLTATTLQVSIVSRLSSLVYTLGHPLISSHPL